MARWFCVRCGATGYSPASTLAPASSGARSRWRRFQRDGLITCPRCGDRRGHAGVLEWGPGEPRIPPGPSPPDGDEEGILRRALRERLLPVHLGAAERAEMWLLGHLWPHLSRERAIEKMMALRGYPEDLAGWLADLGVRWGDGPRLLALAQELGIPEDLRAVFTPLRSRGLLIPVRWWLPDGSGMALAGFQARAYGGSGPRYLTLRIFRDWTPPAGWLPPPDFPGKAEAIILTEGWLKAAVAAFFMGRPAVGFLGLPRRAQSVARRLREAGIRQVILAPDRDGAENPAVRRAFQEMARAIRAIGLEVQWAEWPAEAGKGIDDALLAVGLEGILLMEIPAGLSQAAKAA